MRTPILLIFCFDTEQIRLKMRLGEDFPRRHLELELGLGHCSMRKKASGWAWEGHTSGHQLGPVGNKERKVGWANFKEKLNFVPRP
jgi:hypothetical protein